MNCARIDENEVSNIVYKTMTASTLIVAYRRLLGNGSPMTPAEEKTNLQLDGSPNTMPPYCEPQYIEADRNPSPRFC